MNSEGKFWISIWALVAIGFLGLAGIFATYYTNANNVKLAFVKEGYTPIEASCALDDSMGNNPTCVALIVKGK